jgi:hypothetical protein
MGNLFIWENLDHYPPVVIVVADSEEDARKELAETHGDEWIDDCRDMLKRSPKSYGIDPEFPITHVVW